MRRAALGIIPFILPIMIVADASGQSPTASGRIATLPADSVTEASGVTASRKHPGVFWTHGDSGNDSFLYAFDRSGSVLSKVEVKGAPNLDWEDIAIDSNGQLYIGDIGDGGHYAVRNIYILDEPDPRNPPAEPVAVKRTLAFRHPDGKRFDMEALFFHGKSLYIIAKSKLPGSKLFRVRDSGNPEVELELVASLPVHLATGADASADGKRLVICTYHGLWVFPINGSEDVVDVKGMKVVAFRTTARVEGCTFDGPDVLLIDEQGNHLLRVASADIERESRLDLE